MEQSSALKTSTATPAAVPAAAELTFQDMRLRVGDRAQLEPPAQTGVGRLQVSVVGWVAGGCLIVTAPRTARGRLDLRAGEIVLLRAFTGRRAFAFRCTVLKRNAPPFDYLHLSFPDRVQGLDVRNAPRVRVGLPAKAAPAGAKGEIALQIENLSATGALLVAPEPLGAIGETVNLALEFTLHEIPVPLSLACAIRSIRSEQDGAGEPRNFHGVSFEGLSNSDRLMLSAFVWFQMYENPGLAA
jgi:hypothetical protein